MSFNGAIVATIKDITKYLIAKTCSPRLQHQIRRFYLARQVITKRDFHEVEMEVLGQLIAAGDSVADIGANVGAYTKQLSSLVANSGRVYAFEPVAANYDIFQTVIRRARLTNVLPFRIALGSKPEKREMVVPEMRGFTGYYWAHFAQPGEAGEKVDVSTLDDLCRQGIIRNLDFIKCDVEGSELEVIQGAVQLIDSQRPAWLLEVARPTSGEIFELFHGFGYQAFVYEDGLIPTDGYRDKEFSNYFFFHRESKVGRRLKLPSA